MYVLALILLPSLGALPASVAVMVSPTTPFGTVVSATIFGMTLPDQD